MASTSPTAASAAAGGSPSPKAYAGKAHENVPEFSNKASDYKEYRKRLALYDRKMFLAGRQKETAFNVMTTLTGRAWDAVEDLGIPDLESEDGMKLVMGRLDKVFKYDAITELPGDFESFFLHTQRRRGQTLQEYTADFERQLRKLEQHSVTLPEKVIGWLYLRRSGLRLEQRQLVMSTLQTENLSLDTVRKSLNFVIGQDSMPSEVGPSTKVPARYKDSMYYGEDDDWSWHQNDDVYYGDDDQEWDDWVDEDATYYEAEEAGTTVDEEEVLLADEAATEYDDVYAAYVEARQKMNQLRVSRGYYPVVAVVPTEQKGSGSYKGSSKGKSKSKKGGKSKGSYKQAPKSPTGRARGKAVLGSIKCLRCGQAGHYAKHCPQAGVNKRKAETGTEDAVNMVEDLTADDDAVDLDGDVNMMDEADSEPEDVAIWDCGAASVLVSRAYLRKYVKHLMMLGYETDEIQAWTCTKGFKFGNGNKDATNQCVLLPTFFGGVRRDILVYVIGGRVPFLIGRPLMEKLGIMVDYQNKKIRWPNGNWINAPLGPKGEYIVHLAEDYQQAGGQPVCQTLVPDDFDSHVKVEEKIHIMKVIDYKVARVCQVSQDEDKPSKPKLGVSYDEVQEPSSCSMSPVTPTEQEIKSECDEDTQSTSGAASVPDPAQMDVKRLPASKLRKLTASSMNYVKSVDKMLNEAR